MTLRSLLLIIVCSALAPAMAGVASASEADAAFLKASESYENGDYEDAIAGYAAIVEEGVVEADLFYNLGNAYYKVGVLGYAVLYFERAHRLAPRDDDIQHNLHLSRALLRDSQFISEPGWIRRGVMWVHNNLNAAESFILVSLLYFFLVAAIIAFVFHRTEAVSRIYMRMSMLSPGRLFGFQKRADLALAVGILLVLTSAVAVSAWEKQSTESERRVAVIIKEEVSVFSGPGEDSTLQFKVHEGTLVEVNQARPGWLKIELPGELTGWIVSTSAERI